MVYYKTKYSAKGSSLSSLNYRFGYQGSEKDNEVNSSNGTSYTTEFRQLDTRLGRWFSSDPVFQPWQSSYTSMDNNPINLTDVDGDCTDCKTKGLKKGNIVKDKKGNSWLYWGKNNDNKPEWYPLLPEVKISAPRKKSNLFKNAWSSVKQAASWFVNKIGELDVNLAIESSILNVAGDAIDNYRKGKKWVTITSDLWEGLGAVFQRLPKLKLQEGKRKYVDPTERQTREKKPDVIEKQTKQLEVLSETPKKAPDKDKLNNDLKSSNNQIHNKPNVENEVQSILIEEDKVGGVYDKNHLIKETGGNDLILSQSNGKINDEIIYLFRIQMKKTATYKYYKRAENSVNIIRIS